MTTPSSRDYYNGIADGYDALYAQEQLDKLDAAASRLIEHFKPTNETKVLDVGCGSGVSSDYWVRRFACDVTGIDPAERLIERNSNKLSKFVVGSAEQLPFEKNSFEMVVSFTAIQNFVNVELGVDEILRVGKSWFVLSCLTRTDATNIIRQKLNSDCVVHEEFVQNNDTIFIASRR